MGTGECTGEKYTHTHILHTCTRGHMVDEGRGGEEGCARGREHTASTQRDTRLKYVHTREQMVVPREVPLAVRVLNVQPLRTKHKIERKYSAA